MVSGTEYNICGIQTGFVIGPLATGYGQCAGVLPRVRFLSRASSDSLVLARYRERFRGIALNEDPTKNVLQFPITMRS